MRQTGLSHACASGFMPILELLSTVADDVDPNLADNDGNTPLIFAAQAGKSDWLTAHLSICEADLPSAHSLFLQICRFVFSGYYRRSASYPPLRNKVSHASTVIIVSEGKV